VDSKEFPGVRDRLEQREVRVQLVQLEIQDLQVIGVALAIPGPVD
jgi:phosphoribosyl-dephospho-CoA transferase